MYFQKTWLWFAMLTLSLSQLLCVTHALSASAETNAELTKCAKIAKYLQSRAFKSRPFDYNENAVYQDPIFFRGPDFYRQPIPGLLSDAEANLWDKRKLQSSDYCILVHRPGPLPGDEEHWLQTIHEYIKRGGEIESIARFLLARFYEIDMEGGRLFESQKNYFDLEKAVEEYYLASKDPQLTSECLLRIALIRHQQGRDSEASSIIAEIEKRPPLSCDTLQLAVQVYKAIGEKTKELKAYKMLNLKYCELVRRSNESVDNKPASLAIKYCRMSELREIKNAILKLEKELQLNKNSTRTITTRHSPESTSEQSTEH